MRDDSLEERTALLEAERAVLRTLHAYGHAIDYGDEEGWVDCFTEDGVFDVRSRHEHQLKRLVRGRDELRAFISRHTRAPELWHKHLLIEPVITVTGSSATSVAYFVVVMEHEDIPVLRVFGRYRDRLVRGDDGRWRFAERIAEIESMRGDLPPFVDGRSST